MDGIWITINLLGSEIEEIVKGYDGKVIKRAEKSKLHQVLVKNEDLENTKRVLKAIMHLAKLSGPKENKQLF